MPSARKVEPRFAVIISQEYLESSQVGVCGLNFERESHHKLAAFTNALAANLDRTTVERYKVFDQGQADAESAMRKLGFHLGE